MAQQNSLPTWAHINLDTLISLMSDSAGKMRQLRRNRTLPKEDLDMLEDAFDDLRLAHRYALAMRERQEDIVEGIEHGETTAEG